MSILQEGDFVGFAATSSGLEGRDPTPAINYFEKVLNLRVKLAPNLNKAYRYMAGTDEERAQALTRMYEDKEIKAIFTIRGAGGSFRMLSLLNYNIIKKNSKPLFGLSDVSSVQNAILSKTNNSCYTGFLPLYNINQGGINEEMATTLAALTLPQMVKLAETNQLVCHFRFDSHQTITQLTQDSRVDDLQQIHTGIMLSTRLLNDVNQPEEALRKKRA